MSQLDLARTIQGEQYRYKTKDIACKRTPYIAGKATPICKSFRRSSLLSVQSSDTASFGQQSLALSCDVESSDEEEESSLVHCRASNPWSIARNYSMKDVTFSPVEIARARSCSESISPTDAHLDSIDFDETIDPDVTSSGTQAESLIATQSQHLSQANTESSQYNSEPQGDDTLEHITYCELPLTIGSAAVITTVNNDVVENESLAEMASTKLIPKDQGQSDGKDDCLDRDHTSKTPNQVDFLDANCGIDSTGNEGSLNDSELLLACNNQEMETNVEANMLVMECNEAKREAKTQLNIKAICNSFDDDDSELLLAEEMLNSLNVNEQVPDSEVQPNTELQLPHSEGLDSFLQSQVTDKSACGLATEIFPNCGVEVNSETNSGHKGTILLDSEDLFPEGGVCKENTIMASVIKENERINVTETTTLPDSENLDQFLNASQNFDKKMDSAYSASTLESNSTVSGMLYVPDSERLESFLNSDRTETQTRSTIDRHLSVEGESVMSSNSAAYVTRNATADTITMKANGSEGEQSKTNAIKSCDEHVGNIKSENVNNKFKLEESLTNDESCHNNVEYYSNDLFSASECEMSISVKEDIPNVEDSDVIPDTQSLQPNLLNTGLPVVHTSERRKSVHFAQKLLWCENISGIDLQMRTNLFNKCRKYKTQVLPEAHQVCPSPALFSSDTRQKW